MEDGVTAREAESMVVTPIPGKIDREEEANHVDEAQGEEKTASGFMKNIISNLIPDSGEAQKDDKEAGNGVVEAGDGGQNGVGEGGLMNNLISNFFHQGEGEGGRENESEENEPVVKRLKTTGEEEKEEGNGGGGVINNLISNIFHHTHSESNVDGEDKSKEANKTEEIGDGDRAICAEDGVPTSDEAAFLIHSIHD